MSIKDRIKKWLNKNNPELVAGRVTDKVADSYQERVEEGEKDPLDKTTEELIELIEKHPERKAEILAKISEDRRIPDRIFEKTAVAITENKDIPNSVIPNVINRDDTNISDESIDKIINEGNLDINNRFKLINSMEDTDLVKGQVKKELRRLYKICKDKNDIEVVDGINRIKKLLNPKDIDENVQKEIQTVVAKKMAENYYSEIRKGTNIYTLSKAMPTEKMIEKDLATTVEQEFKKIEEKRGEKKGRFNKEELQRLILEEFGKQIGIKYQKTGVLDVPQSENLKKTSPEQQKDLVKTIQIYSREDLNEGEISDIEEQIKGNPTKAQAKENQIIYLIKQLPKNEKVRTIDILTSALNDPKEIELLGKLLEIPEEKKAKVIDAINGVLTTRKENNKSDNDKENSNSTHTQIDNPDEKGENSGKSER